MEHVSVLPVVMTPAVLVAYILGLSLLATYKRMKTWLPMKKAATITPALPAPAPTVVQSSPPEHAPAAMAVRDMQDGKATLIVRYRPRKKVVSAIMIVWAGVNKRAENRLEDSYYDLGFFDAQEVSNAVIARAVDEANKKLAELAPARKCGANAEAAVAMTSGENAQANSSEVTAVEKSAATLTAKAGASTVVSVAVADDDGEHQPEIKLRKTPSVYRGVILASGMMKRPLDDKIIDSFGIRYRTPEGIEDAVWGVDLRRAMESAKVSVGDYVEILKIGRKTVEKGKAPMNLYQIAKIDSALAAQ